MNALKGVRAELDRIKPLGEALPLIHRGKARNERYRMVYGGGTHQPVNRSPAPANGAGLSSGQRDSNADSAPREQT